MKRRTGHVLLIFVTCISTKELSLARESADSRDSLKTQVKFRADGNLFRDLAVGLLNRKRERLDHVEDGGTTFRLLATGTVPAQDSTRAQVTPPSADISMTVRVYNYAGISVTEFNLARSVASNIFRESGVEITWYDCGPSANADADPYCSASTGLTTFNLRICNDCTAFLKTPEHEVRGFVTGETATVSSTWTTELPTTNYVSSELILGRVIAHELGHILLGPGHSPAGIMKACWTANDLDPGKLGLLVFTKQQGRRIRSALKSRALTSDEGLQTGGMVFMLKSELECQV
jgi:hypothetical protein